jgi:anti-anti-sigma factor
MSCPPEPLLHVVREGGRTTARFARPTSLTEEAAEAAGRELAALLEHPSPPHLTLDLGAVEFLASLALAKFLALNVRVRARGGRLALTNLRPDVRRVFAVTRLDTVLDIRAA